ncbi:unnamed protein product [Callosobruchus maculatus]|uniref:Transmembrane protein 135 N-terminal domain-containing protein n=1 Tax=Callosobruchus maculatus TaxID=64391 RepID=A0A653BE70_CALMS|nr:unnamed protein product [Callosobruchus maculatus]
MPVISKELFYEKVTDSTMCNVIHYWEKDCLKKNFSWYFIKNVILGSGKFFLPVYILKMALNYKKLKNKKFLMSLLLSEVRSIMYSIAMAKIIVATLCIDRALLGRLHYYAILFVPGFMSGLSVLVESKENQILDSLIFFNSFVETVLNKLQMPVAKETLAFMLVSGALMYAFENRKDDIKFLYLWFYTPQRRALQTADKQNNCIHDESCFRYVYQGFCKYFGLGFAVNIIRSGLPRMGKIAQRPSLLMNLLLDKSNVLFGLFIGSYTGMYKLISCYLNRTSLVKKEYQGLLAGILSGVTYAIYPSIQVFLIAITTLLQLIYDHIAKTLKITNSFWQRQLLFMFCNGYLLHNKMFFSETCSPYYSRMIDACTNNLSYNMYRKLLKEYFGIIV